MTGPGNDPLGDALPEEQVIARMLGEVADGGLRSTRGVLQHDALLQLRCVERRAHSAERHDRAVALQGILLELIAALRDPDLRVVAEHLFGLVGGRLAPKRTRLEAAAGRIQSSWETLRKRHVPEVLSELADRLIELERLQRTFMGMERRVPVSSALAVDWLRRFDAYSAMAFFADAMANHLESGLPLTTEEESEPGTSRTDLLSLALFEWTRFSRVEYRYVGVYSGIWMLSDREALSEVREAVRVLDRDVPFTYENASWLRLCLLDARDYEPYDFLRQVRDSPRGQRVLGQWLSWAERCRCRARPMKSCPAHAFVGHGHRLHEIMLAEWERVADWYREPASQRYLSFPDQLA